MSDYISREPAIEALREDCENCPSYHFCDPCYQPRRLNRLSKIPAADVRPVVRGKWQETDEPMGWTDVACACCSVCGESFVLGEFEFSDLAETFKYCPNCGAEMVGGQNGEM